MSIYQSSLQDSVLLIFIVNNERQVQQLIVFHIPEDGMKLIREITMIEAFDDEFVPLYESGKVIINSIYCEFNYQEVDLVDGSWKHLKFPTSKIVGFSYPYVLVEDKESLIIKKMDMESGVAR